MRESCFRNLLWQGQNGVVAELLVSPGEFLRSAPETISSAVAGISSEPGATKPLHETGIDGKSDASNSVRRDSFTNRARERRQRNTESIRLRHNVGE
jgi:hypothetical protein